MDLVPIRIKIGLNASGRHDYPSFNEIPAEARGSRDWSIYVDLFGGWYYDNEAGHADDDIPNGSPVGTWIGMLLVPEDFADAAVRLFPGSVTEIPEAQAESFYEDRSTKAQSAIRDDAEALQAIKARRDAGIPDDDDVANALDVDHPQSGRRRNKTKTWAGLKLQRGIKIKNRP